MSKEKDDFKGAKKECKRFLKKQVLILKKPTPAKDGSIKARPFDKDDVWMMLGAIAMAYPGLTYSFLEKMGFGPVEEGNED